MKNSAKENSTNKVNMKELFIKEILEKIDSVNANEWEGYVKENFDYHPKNAFTKRKYKGLNCLTMLLDIILKQRMFPEYATFKQISQHGGKVKKGAKSLLVEFFSWGYMHKETRKKISLADLRELSIEKRKEYCKFPIIKNYRVFNIADTDIERIKVENDSPEIDDSEMENDLDIEIFVQNLQDNKNLNLRHMNVSTASYSPMIDTVTMPQVKDFVSIDRYYATLFHELVHWTGHESRLNRLDSIKFADRSYCFEELIAELGSMFLCIDFEILSEFTNSLRYLKGWSRAKKENLEDEFRKAFSKSQSAIVYMK